MSVDVEAHDQACVVTMRWPEKRNALGPDEVDALAGALEEAARTDRAAVVLTGEGAFCSGGDLRAFSELSRTASVDAIRDVVYGRVQHVVRQLGSCPVPTIAAVDGPAIGLGMDLALACDILFVGADGWLQQGWARAGLIPGVGGAAFLHARHPSLLWRLVAEQPRLDAAACDDLRIAERADGGALTSALDRARALARVRRPVLEAYAELVRPLRWPTEEHFSACAAHQAEFIGSAEFREFSTAALRRSGGSRP